MRRGPRSRTKRTRPLACLVDGRRVEVVDLDRLQRVTGINASGDATTNIVRRFTTIPGQGTGGFSTRPSKKNAEGKQIKIATIGGYNSLTTDGEAAIGQFLANGCSRSVPEVDNLSRRMQIKLLSMKQHEQIQRMFVTNPNNAIFLDNLPALCGENDHDSQVGTNLLQRAQARQTEKIPTWLNMSVPWRWQWKPDWRPDEVTAVRESDPYKVLTLGYQFVDEKGKSYVIE